MAAEPEAIQGMAQGCSAEESRDLLEDHGGLVAFRQAKRSVAEAGHSLRCVSTVSYIAASRPAAILSSSEALEPSITMPGRSCAYH